MLTLNRRIALALLVGALCAATATASPMLLVDGDGDDSGWSVELFGAADSVWDVEVETTAGTVTFSVAKFYEGMEDQDGGMTFEPAYLVFTRVGDPAASAGQIVVRQERIVNNAPMAIDHYAWRVAPNEIASFNEQASSGWDVGPFAASEWLDGPAGTTDRLLAHDGQIAPKGTYLPDGNLTMDVAPDAEGEASFTLYQTAAPEPATLTLLVVGGAAAVLRRRRPR